MRVLYLLLPELLIVYFFFNDTATTEIYTLSLHDALPIRQPRLCGRHHFSRWCRDRPGGDAPASASDRRGDRRLTQLVLGVPALKPSEQRHHYPHRMSVRISSL